MADNVTQDIVEVLSNKSDSTNVTQNVIEIASPIVIPVRTTQEIVEIAGKVEIPIAVTQNIVEIILRPLNLSGIYFINPLIIHDTYYLIETKIPDPTIETALLEDPDARRSRLKRG